MAIPCSLEEPFVPGVKGCTAAFGGVPAEGDTNVVGAAAAADTRGCDHATYKFVRLQGQVF